MRYQQLFFVFILFLGILAAGSGGLAHLHTQESSVFLVDSMPPKKLLSLFTAARGGKTPLKILIVPGHAPYDPGAAFGAVTEYDLNMELATVLRGMFAQEQAFVVTLTRDWSGTHPALDAYMTENRDAIMEFRKKKMLGMYSVLQAGLVEDTARIEHNVTTPEAVATLYGINKWANEIGTHLVLHVHFNDVPRKKTSLPGRYSGFAVYIPERQYSNASGSKALGEKVYARLISRFPVSDMLLEAGGMVEDQELIGLGAHNSLDAAALFIEYAYIYEPQFQNAEVRSAWIREAAFQTYLGIMDFFENRSDILPATTLLPHTWNRPLSFGRGGSRDVLALQAALTLELLYPPSPRTRNDCPLSGSFFECTREALRLFQKKYSLVPSGVFDRLTRAQLHVLYGE